MTTHSRRERHLRGRAAQEPYVQRIDPRTAGWSHSSLHVVDVKIQISPIGRQMVITRDNVNVEMCARPLVRGRRLTGAATRSSISRSRTRTVRHSALAIYAKHSSNVLKRPSGM